MKLDAAEYQHTSDALMGVARLVHPLPLRAMVEAIDRATGYGFPQPDPLPPGHEQLGRIRHMANALLAFQIEVEAQLEAAVAGAPPEPEQAEGPGLRCPDCDVKFTSGSELFTHACQTGADDG